MRELLCTCAHFVVLCLSACEGVPEFYLSLYPPGTPISVLTEQLSNKINALNDGLQSSSLWLNTDIRRRVLARAVPKTLLRLVGVDKLQERVPGGPA